jgi:nucleoside-diphosphate-sugar epimerase
MKIAVTGATGFLGRYLVSHLLAQGHDCRCWYRPDSDRSDLPSTGVEWIPGQLNDAGSTAALLVGCDAVIHAALDRPGVGFRGAEGDLLEFASRNLLGTLRLIEAARQADVSRFVFISTCAVHERILDDRPLDETHPTWPLTHYGAHKAALEMFVHSYGWGQNFPICALRPTGIYGVAHPVEDSKWYELVAQVVRGEAVQCGGGGKEVHAHDVARAAELLLHVEGTRGECFNCYDRYVSEYDVALLAQELSGSQASIEGERKSPKHQIVNQKLRALGMEFGGDQRLRDTVAALVDHLQQAGERN